MYSEVFAANASSWVDSPALASVISAATVSASARCRWATTCSPMKTVSPSTRILVPSLTAPKISVPTLSSSGDAGCDDHLGPEVRVAAGDARLGVDDGGRLGRDQRLGGDPVEVDVVDDRDVAGVEPAGQAGGAAVEARDAADAGQAGRAAAQGGELHGIPCCHPTALAPAAPRGHRPAFHRLSVLARPSAAAVAPGPRGGVARAVRRRARGRCGRRCRPSIRASSATPVVAGRRRGRRWR